MALALFLLFVVLPFVELAVIIAIGQQIGALNTIAVLMIIGAVGAWLSKREGLVVLRRLNVTLNEGRLPTNELIDGGLILFAGALMVAPGFLTDVVGILLIVPPTRSLVRGVLIRRFKDRIERSVNVGGAAGFNRSFGGSGFGSRAKRPTGDVFDTTATDGAPTPPPSPRSNPELGRY